MGEHETLWVCYLCYISFCMNIIFGLCSFAVIYQCLFSYCRDCDPGSAWNKLLWFLASLLFGEIDCIIGVEAMADWWVYRNWDSCIWIHLQIQHVGHSRCWTLVNSFPTASAVITDLESLRHPPGFGQCGLCAPHCKWALYMWRMKGNSWPVCGYDMMLWVIMMRW